MRRSLKVLLTALMALMLCLQLAVAEEHEEVTLCLYTENATNGANEARLAEFEALYPWIHVDLVEMPAGSTDRMQQLSTILQSHDSSMDVFIVDCTWPETFVSAGWLAKLDDEFTQEALSVFSEGALEGCRIDGGLYALPLFVNTGALLYRADLLEKYGFEPAKTWDELIEQSKVVMAGEENVYGYAAAWQQAEALTCCMMEHIWNAGGEVLDEEGNPDFDNEKVAAGLAEMEKLLDAGICAEGIMGMAAKDVRAALFAGQLLYARDWSVQIGNANNPENSSVAGLVKLAPLPTSGEEYTSYNCNGGWNIGISAFTEHKEEAVLLVKYWTSESAMLYNAILNDKMPARPALYANQELIDAQPDMAGMLELAENCKNRPNSAYYEEVSAAMQQATTDVLMGQKSIEDAIAVLQKTEEDIYSW